MLYQSSIVSAPVYVRIHIYIYSQVYNVKSIENMSMCSPHLGLSSLGEPSAP